MYSLAAYLRAARLSRSIAGARLLLLHPVAAKKSQKALWGKGMLVTRGDVAGAEARALNRGQELAGRVAAGPAPTPPLP